MQLLEFLQQNLILALIIFGILGLCIGSFINVVIYRTPLKMEKEWREGTVEFLQSQGDFPKEHVQPIVDIIAEDAPITLSRPASHCPNCGHKIAWYENIPLISWLILRGRCSECANPIGLRYPFVELVTALFTVLVIYKLGVTFQGFSALILVWTLIALTGIDFDTQFLPDRYTYPLAGLGLAVNSKNLFISPSASIWGLIIGFLSLWIVTQIYYLITKKHGMGHGDFKLLAVLGAWLGAMMLPFIILLSSLIGSFVGVILLRRAGESKPFAFGPYIAVAGIIALLYGEPIMNMYLGQFN